jgi:hypothetical protein
MIRDSDLADCVRETIDRVGPAVHASSPREAQAIFRALKEAQVQTVLIAATEGWNDELPGFLLEAARLEVVSHAIVLSGRVDSEAYLHDALLTLRARSSSAALVDLPFAPAPFIQLLSDIVAGYRTTRWDHLLRMPLQRIFPMVPGRLLEKVRDTLALSEEALLEVVGARAGAVASLQLLTQLKARPAPEFPAELWAQVCTSLELDPEVLYLGYAPEEHVLRLADSFENPSKKHPFPQATLTQVLAHAAEIRARDRYTTELTLSVG